jgi:hypothetical protein
LPLQRVEGRIVNLDAPDNMTGPYEMDTAFKVLADVQRKMPGGRFELQQRTVTIGPWEAAG